MRITKVKIGGEDVLIDRNSQEAFLIVGNSVKIRSNIYETIINDKKTNIINSLINKILKAKPETKKDLESRQVKSYEQLKNIIETILIQVWDGKDVLEFDSLNSISASDIQTEDGICNYIKYKFKKDISNDKPSLLISSLMDIINRKDKQIAACWQDLVKKEKHKFYFIAKSISYNAILSPSSNQKSQHSEVHESCKTRRDYLLWLYQKDNYNQVATIIDELAKSYDLYGLLISCNKTIQEKIKSNQEKQQHSIKQLGSVLKRVLHAHQKALFGKEAASGQDNRNKISLNFYHQLVKEYFETMYPVKGRHFYDNSDVKLPYQINKSDLDYFCDFKRFNYVIKQKVRNKLRSIYVSEGKLLSSQSQQKRCSSLCNDLEIGLMSKPVTSQLLQQQKIVLTFKKKLIDDINFGSNQLRNIFANQNEFIERVQSLVSAYSIVENINNNQKIRFDSVDVLNNILAQLSLAYRGCGETLIEGQDIFKVELTGLQAILVKMTQSDSPTQRSELGCRKGELLKSIAEKFNIIRGRYSSLAKLSALVAEDGRFDKGDFIGSKSEILKQAESLQIIEPLYFACLDAIKSIRHGIFHHQQIKFTQFENSINKKALSDKLNGDIASLPSEYIKRLYSNYVFKYYQTDELERILPNNIQLNYSPVAFMVSFKNVINRAKGLKYFWAAVLDNNKKNQNISMEQQQALRYLLSFVYQYDFVHSFQDEKLFFAATKAVKVKSQARVKDMNRILKNNPEHYNQYNEIFELNFIAGQSPKDYLARIHSYYINQQNKQDDVNKQNKFHDYLIDLFVEGFNYYIEKLDISDFFNKKQEVEQLTEIQNEDAAISHFANSMSAKICTISVAPHEENPALLYWYGLFLLLNKQRINQLKADLIKYKRLSEQLEVSEQQRIVPEIDEIILLLTVRSFYADRADYLDLIQDDKQKENSDKLKFMSLFIDLSGSTTEEYLNSLREFEPSISYSRQQLYLSGNDIIPIKGIDKAYKYHAKSVLENLFLTISNSEEYKNIAVKITQQDLREFYQNEHKYKECIVRRHKLHAELVVKKTVKIDSDQLIEYKHLLAVDLKYNWLRSRITCSHIEQLSDLLHDIFAVLIRYASIWERDIYFTTLTLLESKGLLSDDCIQQNLQNDSSKVTFVEQVLKLLDSNEFIKNHPDNQIQQQLEYLMNFKDYADFENKKEIRNNLAHYHYFRGNSGQKLSILDYLSKVRLLMSYDRKRKNEITKVFIELLNKKGISVRLSITHSEQQEHIQLIYQEIKPYVDLGDANNQKVLPCVVEHFKKQKNDIFSYRLHPEYCRMVEALLELKR